MSDTQGTDPISSESEELIQELLDAGFAYEPNGRLAGLAPTEDDADADDVETPSEDSDDPDSDEDGSGAAGGELPDGGADDGHDDGDAGRGAHSGRLELKGTPLTELEAENLLRIRQVLIDHPEMVEEMEARLAGRSAIPPPAPPTPADETPPQPIPLPEELDADDPATVRLWGEIQRVQQRQVEVDGAVTGALEEASAAKVQNDIAAAVDRFKIDHPDLSDEDITNIRNYTAANVNIQGVMSNFPLDPVLGLLKSMEIGSMSDPSVRDKVLKITPDDQEAKDRERQANLSKLSGSSGSARRGPAKPARASNYQQAAQMIASELEALGGTTP